MAPTCFLFPVFGLTARGGAPDPTIGLKPKSLGGEGNELRRLHAAKAARPVGVAYVVGHGPALAITCKTHTQIEQSSQAQLALVRR
jgi:hypothetical protein